MPNVIFTSFFHFVPLLETLQESTRQWKLGQSRYRVRDAGVDNMLTLLLVTEKLVGTSVTISMEGSLMKTKSSVINARERAKR